MEGAYRVRTSSNEFSARIESFLGSGLPSPPKIPDLSEISCEGHNDGKEGDIVWRDGSNRLFPTSCLISFWREPIVVNFEGTLAELFAALPKSIEVQNLQCLAPLSPAEPTQQTLKLTGAFRHMDEHTVAEIYAGFDAGLTIEQLMAQSGYSYRAVADRRKQWKKLRGLNAPSKN